ncbi:MAG: poly(3-hydroxybutyrate) depolymerase [Microbacterium sp.]|nr:poly(3-hydroxybutyrate) depolymerase [Microbacterium sp.]
MRVRSLAAFLLLVGTALAGCASPMTAPTPTPRPSASITSPTPSATTVGCGVPVPDPVGKTTPGTLAVDGQNRTFAVHVPADYDATTPTPVILAFHGHGMSPTALEGFSDLDDSGALVVYPKAGGASQKDGWQGAPYSSGLDDVGFVSSLIDTVSSRYCVDADRVSAVGISNGGGFVALLACTLPDRIAAFAVVAGAVYPAYNPGCPTALPTPIIEFHGTADPVTAFDGADRNGTPLASVSRWLTREAQRNGCAPQPTRTRLGSDVDQNTWTGCQGRGALIQYRVNGGGHTWPGAVAQSGPGVTTQTISATDLILAFFEDHPLT